MKWIKRIVLVLFIPYLFWHIYKDIDESRQHYIYEAVKHIETFHNRIIFSIEHQLSITRSACFEKKTHDTIEGGMCDILKIKTYRI